MIPDDPIDASPQADEPAAKPTETQPPNGNGQEQPETISDLVRKAREGIPVDEHGVQPTAYQHQVTIAQDRAKAYVMLPDHLHDNVAVVAGLVGIAARFNLDPLMLASQTYIQNGRLCYQAQAFGAILYGSKLLIGRLRFAFNGEGADMTCTVSGRFKDDPDTLFSATTPPLKQLHPGTTQKDGKVYVKGSPLWDKDPEQQLAYFGERRWIRRHAPDCCMGMYTREEIADIDDYRANRQGAIPLTADRLGQLDTGEGWGEGQHLDLDLAAIEPEQPESAPPEPKSAPAPKAAPRPARSARGKPVQGRKPTARSKARPAQKTRPGRPAQPRHQPQRRPPTRAEVQAAAKRAEHPPRRVEPRTPKWLDYVSEAEAWIKAVADAEQGDKADARWEAERDRRDQLQVPMGERSRLRAILDRKLAVVRPKPKEE